MANDGTHTFTLDYKFTTAVNPDSVLLAEHLRAEFENVMAAGLVSNLDEETRSTLAWYRVAERAKELRA